MFTPRPHANTLQNSPECTPEPLWNHSGTTPEPPRNTARSILGPPWNHPGTTLNTNPKFIKSIEFKDLSPGTHLTRKSVSRRFSWCNSQLLTPSGRRAMKETVFVHHPLYWVKFLGWGYPLNISFSVSFCMPQWGHDLNISPTTPSGVIT